MGNNAERAEIAMLENVLRMLKWCEDVGYRPPISDLSRLIQDFDDYVEGVKDRSAI